VTFLDSSPPRVITKIGSTLQLWNATSLKPAGMLTLPPGAFPESNGMAVSSNLRYVAIVANEGAGVQLTIYDPANPLTMILRRIQATSTPVEKLIGIAFSPDSKQIAICVVMQEVTTVLPFNVSNGTPLFTPILSTRQPAPTERTLTPGFMWLQNGLGWLVEGNDLYDTTGKKLGSLHLNNVTDARLVGTDSFLMLQQTQAGPKRAVLANFDDAKIKAAIDKFKE
jgi:hypothetical protein